MKAGTPLAVCLSAVLLAACVSSLDSKTTVVAHDDRPATVSPGAAAAMISEYRRGSGLSSVSVDGKLNAICAAHARRMASANKLAHVLPGEGSFAQRLGAGGYQAALAVENVGAGYNNLDEAFAGWKKSPSHRRNMLKSGVNRMGIAVAYAGDTRFKDWWCLILAQPDEQVAASRGGPTAGPLIAVPR